MDPSKAPVIANLYGTEQLNDIITAIIEAVKAGKAAIADGKFGVTDIMLAVPLARPANDVVDGFDETDDEFLDLTRSEVDGLVERTHQSAIESGLTARQALYARYGAQVVFAIGGGLSLQLSEPAASAQA